MPARVALTVSGHLHGGQVNVPLLRRAVLPTRFGERYIAGHVVERGRHLYVSAGVGTAGLPLRLRRLPEVPVLRLDVRQVIRSPRRGPDGDGVGRTVETCHRAGR